MSELLETNRRSFYLDFSEPVQCAGSGGALSARTATVIAMADLHLQRPAQQAGQAVGAGSGWTARLALALAAVAVLLGVLALLRSPGPAAPAASSSAPSSSVDAAAGRDTCGVAVGAAEAIARERRPFLAAPTQWDDPVTVAALTRVQAAATVELAAMEAAVGPATPPDVAAAITAYRAAMLDVLDADTRRLPATASNAAADRAAAAARTITDLCRR